MKFRKGDRVKFLNDVGEGTIVSFTDKNTALVSTSDGFDIPVLLNELVRMGDYESAPEIKHEPKKPEFAEENSAESEEAANITDEEIALAFTLDHKSSEIRSYLVNSSTYHLYYVISSVKEGEELIYAHGQLEPDTKVSLGKLALLKMDEDIRLNAGLLFYGNHFFRYIKPAQSTLRFDPNDLYSGNSLTENDYFDEDAAVYTLYSFKEKAEEQFGDKRLSGNLNDLIVLKEQKKEIPVAKKSVRQPEVEEVDLHIESIIDDHSDLTNGEIVDLQMGRFRTSLETAIIHKSRRIVFIHGVGNGKLKHEIRRTLDRQYPQLKYQDASFREYGYGATMVIIPT